MSKMAEVEEHLKWVPIGTEAEQTVADPSDAGNLFGSPPGLEYSLQRSAASTEQLLESAGWLFGPLPSHIG